MPAAQGAPQRQTYTDRQRFIVWVLWLHGLSEPQAGAMAGLRRKQAAGIIWRSEYRNRGAMSFAERYEKLNELKAARYDGAGNAVDDNLLPDRVFTPLPLDR